MRYFLLLFLSGISILFSGCQKQKNITSWQDRADSLIQNGELNKAQAYIDSIQTVYPEKNRWQIDSLSQIIQRIRRDFSISQTDGIQPVSYTHLDVYKRQLHCSLSPLYVGILLISEGTPNDS